MLVTRKLNNSQIDPQALRLVRKLQKHNHTAYFVGGCVRDLLLGLTPKDFDIATSATPRQVNRIIRPSHIIGRRFKLVLFRHFGKQYEISTFRRQSPEEENGGLITNDNTFGTAKEDAKRRDFTINALFYDPIKYELIDHCQGLIDMEQRKIRMIGVPTVRIQEDPLRMLRALRFAYKTNFLIEESLREAIKQMASQLRLTVLPRRREEFLKFLRLETATHLLWECHDLNLLKHLNPELDRVLSKDGELFTINLNRGLECVSNNENSAELFSLLLFSFMCSKVSGFCEQLTVPEELKESLEAMMKDELGMHRSEQELFFQNLQLIKSLQKIKDIKKTTVHYRKQVLKNPCLGPSLTLCMAYQLLPEPDLYFWTKEYWNFYGR